MSTVITATVRANTLVANDGVSATTLTKQHAAKAWVYFDTGDNPPNPDGSFGVSSLTDNSAEVEVNLTSAMSDLFYCPVAGGGHSSSTNPANRSLQVIVMSTTKVDSEIYTTANNQAAGQNHIAVLGDLA